MIGRIRGAAATGLVAAAVSATALATVGAGRTYAGRIGGSNRIYLTVAADGRKVSALADNGPCPQPPISFIETSFPAARVANGEFSAARTYQVKRSAVTFVVTGRLIGARAGGTASTSTTNYRGQRGRVCMTSERWTATAQPPDFRACVPHPLGDYGVAQDIVDERTACRAVERALTHGSFTPTTLPLSPAASFSTPGWACTTGHRSWTCRTGARSFSFRVAG